MYAYSFPDMLDCGAEPDLVPAHLIRCGEEPLCETVHCFRRIACLIANSTASVLPGCRTPSDDAPYYCICPLSNDPILNRSFIMTEPSTTTFSTTTDHTTTKHDGLSGGAIAGIVIACIAAAIILSVVAFLIFRKIKDRRKNHGVYRPQLEENLHAKNLPYIPPPNVEGLI
uniref:Uncharacterized protein n=1 Tax=Acrobeloides nanus TaxID=290746 RepID=A0A914E4G8_9BILA